LAVAIPGANDNAGIIHVTTQPIDEFVEAAGDSMTLGDSRSLVATSTPRKITLGSSASSSPLMTSVMGGSAGDGLGTVLSSADVDGDGTPELLASAPGEGPFGEVHIYDLPTDMRSTLESIATLIGSGTYPILGSVETGDLSGDGVPDIVLGSGNNGGNADVDFIEALSESELASRIFAIAGSASLPGEIDLGSTAPDFVITSADGSNISSFDLGDVNADSETDIVLSTTDDEVLVFFDLESSEVSSSDADTVITLADSAQMVGIGDVSGDGIGDIVAGIPTTGDENNGAIVIVFGKETWESTIDATSDASVLTISGESHEKLGSDFSIEDVDGDGVAKLFASITDTEGSSEVTEITTTESQTSTDEPATTGTSGSGSSGGGCSLSQEYFY
jgi:hypothetical protein